MISPDRVAKSVARNGRYVVAASGAEVSARDVNAICTKSCGNADGNLLGSLGGSIENVRPWVRSKGKTVPRPWKSEEFYGNPRNRKRGVDVFGGWIINANLAVHASKEEATLVSSKSDRIDGRRQDDRWSGRSSYRIKGIEAPVLIVRRSIDEFPNRIIDHVLNVEFNHLGWSHDRFEVGRDCFGVAAKRGRDLRRLVGCQLRYGNHESCKSLVRRNRDSCWNSYRRVVAGDTDSDSARSRSTAQVYAPNRIGTRIRWIGSKRDG